MDLDKALGYARDVGLSDRAVAVAVQTAADQVRFAQQSEAVTLEHPDLPGQLITVAPDAVDQHMMAGWQIEAPPEPEPDATPKPSRAKKTEEN